MCSNNKTNDNKVIVCTLADYEREYYHRLYSDGIIDESKLLEQLNSINVLDQA